VERGEEPSVAWALDWSDVVMLMAGRVLMERWHEVRGIAEVLMREGTIEYGAKR
jgi:hypothetical protein